MERDFPNDNQNVGVLLTPLRSDLVSDVRQTVLLLFAAVGLLLLIATANVSGLLLARATARHQEIAVRVALGASRGRILAQLLTESIVLAVLGGAAGVLLAMWLIGPLVSLSPADLGVAGAVTVDKTVLLFGLGVSTVAGLLFGLAPAHQLARLDVHGDLKQGARGGSSIGQRRIRAVLVAGEIALSLVLLVGAGLTIRSFAKLQHEPAGFNPDHVLTFGVSLPSARYPTPEQKAEFWQRALEALRQIPGVEIAGATSRLPLLPGNSTRGLMIRDLPPNVQASAHYRTASPDYFRAMGIPLLRGRVFEEADREDGRSSPSSARRRRSASGRIAIRSASASRSTSRRSPSSASSATCTRPRSTRRRSRRSTCRTGRIRGRPWCSRCDSTARLKPCARAFRRACATRSGRSTRISRSAPS